MPLLTGCNEWSSLNTTGMRTVLKKFFTFCKCDRYRRSLTRYILFLLPPGNKLYEAILIGSVVAEQYGLTACPHPLLSDRAKGRWILNLLWWGQPVTAQRKGVGNTKAHRGRKGSNWQLTAEKVQRHTPNPKSYSHWYNTNPYYLQIYIISYPMCPPTT